ncbi:hypothetical protein [Streptantibioticus ferralitis]|uniref:Uncharacterized protein n=1 Tax=Streptantibioticus ferralitis TaxID=236510 RepID=A0ABT5Z7E4_9ACTN|nr:hypothetical protein [Streptantibioticus ferralitis]MDF2259674.1 hypothetical protein [Streptantibioticus ferralitis]
MHAAHLVVMAGIISDTRTLGNQINDLLLNTVMLVITSMVVLGTYATTRSVTKAFWAAVGAALLWVVVANMAWFRDQIGQDVQHPSSAIVITHERVDRLP